MARIRTIKPEFWDSPDTAKAGPWSRLLFIALWNWADDFGRGTANMKELEGFAFPNDSVFADRSGNTVQFPCIVAEVSDCFGVMFYEVSGRPYYAIPSWEEHQRNERRAKQSKYPSPEVRDPVAEIPCSRAEDPNSSGPGTGEKGNRGIGEQFSSSTVASDGRPDEPDPEPRPDVDELLDLLDAEIEANGNRPPKRNKGNHDAMRLILDRDKYTFEQVRYVIGWCQQDNFWKANILSPKKLREKFPQLVARIKSEHERPAGRDSPRNRAQERIDNNRAVVEELKRIEEERENTIQGELI